MKLLHGANNEKGLLSVAFLEDEKGRRFTWSRRIGVTQTIVNYRKTGNGTCEEYERKAGKIDAGRVEQCLKDAGRLETDAQRHIRIAKEAIGF